MSSEWHGLDSLFLEILRYFALLVGKLERRLMHDQEQLEKCEVCYLACEALDGVCQVEILQVSAIDPIFLGLESWSMKVHIRLHVVGQGMRII